jgi:hypothetical protein
MDNQHESTSRRVFFVDSRNEIVSEIKELHLRAGSRSKTTLTLSSKVSSEKNCCLAIQSITDGPDELQQLIPFSLNISFFADVDF